MSTPTGFIFWMESIKSLKPQSHQVGFVSLSGTAIRFQKIWIHIHMFARKSTKITSPITRFQNSLPVNYWLQRSTFKTVVISILQRNRVKSVSCGQFKVKPCRQFKVKPKTEQNQLSVDSILILLWNNSRMGIALGNT